MIIAGNGWFSNGVDEYKLSATTGDFEGAKLSCASESASLTGISSEQENDWIAQVAQGKLVLVGGIVGVNGERSWTNGQEWGYTNWAPGEPNNDKGKEECIKVQKGQWNDAGCGKPKSQFICKRASRGTA